MPARTTLALAALIAAVPAAAQPLVAGSPCGGDAYSTAEVVEGRGRDRGRDRGPLVAVPDTLCADLEPQGPPVGLDVVPLIMPQVGGSPVRDPYDGGPRRRP